MTEQFLRLLFLFLPAFMANATPVVIKNLPTLKTWNKSISEADFGKNKTWRGLIGGIIVAILVAALQYLLIPAWYPFEPTLLTAILCGLLLGTGALVGDLVESWIKRKMDIKPGRPLPFWDGTDYIFGAILFLAPVYLPNFVLLVMLVLIAPLFSLLANVIAYFIGWKNVWH